MDKLSFTVAEASEATGISVSGLREDIRDSRLVAKKRGATVLILADDLKRYLEALPERV